MISSFDKNALFALIKDFYEVIGIRISIFDDQFHNVTEYPVEAPAICALIRSTPQGLSACASCDKSACERARKLRAPHVYKCHIGITEAITPISLSGGILGYAIFAHMLPEDNYNDAIRQICGNCKAYNLDPEKVKDALKTLKTQSTEKIMASMRLLDAISSYLLVKKLAIWRNEDITKKIKEYIDKNLEQNLSSESLCHQFYVSRTKLYQLSVKSFGMGIGQYILNQRIEYSKKLLENRTLSISEIALKVGFADYNYFCKIFKKEIGISPSKFRTAVCAGQN